MCKSRINYLDQAPVMNIVCLCVLYLHRKNFPAPSRPLRARPVKLGRFLITLSEGLLECPGSRAAEYAREQDMERRPPPNEQFRGLENESRRKTRGHDSRREHCLSRESPGYYFGKRVIRPECSSRWLWSDAFSTLDLCMDGGILDFLFKEETMYSTKLLE